MIDIYELDDMLAALDRQLRLLCDDTAVKIPGMKPTLIEALKACDGVTLAAAIKKLVADCGEDRDVCRDVVGVLVVKKLIVLSVDTRLGEVVSAITEAGCHHLATHGNRKTAYSALDDIDSEIGDES